MTGRGIDQAFAHSVDPQLHERYVQSAVDYIRLAERENGSLRLPLGFDYIWGDALKVLEERGPALRIINLETSVTTSDDDWPGKGIHYRMHPDNVEVFKKAGINFCSLANNHVMDWGYAGLDETLDSLRAAQISIAGAGRNTIEARKPAKLPLKEGRNALVYAVGGTECGIPASWAAQADQSGVNLLPDLSRQTATEFAEYINATSTEEELAILSIHWGDNWGYDVSDESIRFAHQLIDESNLDLIHGHSSHHVRPFEVYNGKLILYGCGDFVNDYEGIGGYEKFRSDLSLMYFPKLDAETWNLLGLELVPMQMSRFQLHHASHKDTRWLRDTINRICRPFEISVEADSDRSLVLQTEEIR